MDRVGRIHIYREVNRDVREREREREREKERYIERERERDVSLWTRATRVHYSSTRVRINLSLSI